MPTLVGAIDATEVPGYFKAQPGTQDLGPGSLLRALNWTVIVAVNTALLIAGGILGVAVVSTDARDALSPDHGFAATQRHVTGPPGAVLYRNVIDALTMVGFRSLPSRTRGTAATFRCVPHIVHTSGNHRFGKAAT
jgi:hypothetical protein